mgnify:CR=1 FL=1
MIWLSALPCCWASISISISIPLISPLPLRNFGGGGIFRFPAGCAITFIFLWEATGRGKIRQYANLIITMFLGGLWHGASWNFVLWGMMHGVALAAHKFWMTLTGRKKGTESHGIHRFFGVLVTFHLFVSAGYSSVMRSSPHQWIC